MNERNIKFEEIEIDYSTMKSEYANHSSLSLSKTDVTISFGVFGLNNKGQEVITMGTTVILSREHFLALAKNFQEAAKIILKNAK